MDFSRFFLLRLPEVHNLLVFFIIITGLKGCLLILKQGFGSPYTVSYFQIKPTSTY